MTGNLFLEKLRSLLDFLPQDDINAVLSFYEDKFFAASSADEEEELIKSFGDPVVIANKLRNALEKDGKLPKTSFETVKVDIAQKVYEDNEKAQEEPYVEEIPIEDDDFFVNENEVGQQAQITGSAELVKENTSTVKKALYEHDAESSPVPEPLNEKTKISTVLAEIEKAQTAIEEEKNPEEIENKKNKKKIRPLKTFPGLFKIIIEKMNVKPSMRSVVLVFLMILFSPVIIFATVALIGLYAVTMAIILVISLILFVIIAALVVCAVIELIYGIIMLFDTVPVALIEIGMGTTLFGIVTAIVALNYELLCGVVPYTIKKLTRYYLYWVKYLRAAAFGGQV